MTCRHCQERIKACECGADNGRRHFVDISNSRYCRALSRLHEPVPKGQTA